jgi:multidrug resistance efflux pump
MKLSAGAVFLLAAFVLFAKGEYRIAAPFLLEASVQQSVVAPFDSFLKSVSVEPGDAVTADQTVLGKLETAELRLKLAVLKAEQLGFEKERAFSMRDGKTAEAQMAEAQIAKLAAEIRLVALHIEQAALVAPITGRIVSENLKRQLGLPVEAGDILFEIAGIGQLRAELYVPEESIPEIRVGQSGELASVGYPDRKIPFRVERINPMAEVVNQKNVFAVRARLLESQGWMRPGMEGIAKISAGRRSYAWIWTHRIGDWLRMKLWI